MGAALGRDVAYFQEAATTMIKSRLANRHTIALSEEDVRDLFEGPMMKGVGVVDFPATVVWTHPNLDTSELGIVRPATIEVRFYPASDGGLTPRSPTFVEDVSAWASYQLRLTYHAALASAVVERLHETCSNLNQVRYLWPTIALLADRHTKLKDHYDKRLAEFKVPRTVPTISHGFREAMRESATILTAASLAEPCEKKWPGGMACDIPQYIGFSKHGMSFAATAT